MAWEERSQKTHPGAAKNRQGVPPPPCPQLRGHKCTYSHSEKCKALNKAGDCFGDNFWLAFSELDPREGL